MIDILARSITYGTTTIGILRSRGRRSQFHESSKQVTSCPSLDLPDLLADFHRIYPAIEITLSEANSNVLIEELREGLLDMAIIGLGTAPAAGIETQTIADEALVAAVSLEHPLAGRTTITLQAFEMPAPH